MKKGLAIALALVMLVLFVGCGLASQLSGTKWEIRESETYEGITVETVVTYDFQKDNVLKMTGDVYMNGVLMSEYGMSLTGKWYVDGDELTIEYTEGSVTTKETCIAEIDGDVLKLTMTEDGVTQTISLTRVK